MTALCLDVVMGPTASGKSKLALALALQHNGVVINADSQQVYNALPILTAQPDTQDKAQVEHALYGYLDLPTICTAGGWAHDAGTMIRRVLSEGRRPIVVGGTGFYLMALLQGLRAVPDIPPAVRQAALDTLADQGPALFWQTCQALDPISVAAIAPQDVHRLLRIWEVATATGKPLSTWHQEVPQHTYLPEDLELHGHCLAPERSQLYANINQRTAWMLQHGAVEEVRTLPPLPTHHPLLKAVGVTEIRCLLEGRATVEATIAAMAQRTRRYAKRQTTWFRHQMENIPWVSWQTVGSVVGS